MPKDWMQWLGVVASITTIISFALFIRERHKREREADLFLGSLRGLKALVKGMAQAGDEWRHKVNEKPDGYAIGYANTCTNTWITLREQVNEMISRVDNSKRMSRDTAPEHVA